MDVSRFKLQPVSETFRRSAIFSLAVLTLGQICEKISYNMKQFSRSKGRRTEKMSRNTLQSSLEKVGPYYGRKSYLRVGHLLLGRASYGYKGSPESQIEMDQHGPQAQEFINQTGTRGSDYCQRSSLGSNIIFLDCGNCEGFGWKMSKGHR